MNILSTRKDEARETRTIAPAVDIFETDKAVTIKAEIPGVDKADIRLELHGDELTIAGARKPAPLPDGYAPLHQERLPCEYSRKFTLGQDIARDGIEAVYEHGILSVTLNKSEATRPRKIEIS